MLRFARAASTPDPREPAAERRTARRGAGFLAVFGAVFGVAGLWALSQLRPGSGADLDDEGRIAAGVVGAIFTAAGLGIVWLAAHVRRGAEERFASRQRHPDAPWLWDREWASREIAGSGRATLAVSWTFALFWNAISWPLLPRMLEALGREHLEAAIALLFPAVGAGLLAWALRETARQRRYGRTVLELSTLPGVVGGELEGVVHLSRAFAPEGGFALQLDCVRETSGSGSDDSSQESILWQEKETVPLHATRRGRLGTDVPVCFRIPWDEPPTGSDGPRRSILWRLTVSATAAGIDFRSHFLVPVFVTADSDASLTAQALRAPEARAAASAEALPGSKIGVARTAEGGVALSFGAARNPGAAAGLSAFAALWTGMVIGLPHLGAPLFFPIVFGLFDVLLLGCALALWAGTTRVVASRSGLAVTSRILGIGRTRACAATEVERIAVGVGMQSGTKVFYSLRAVVRGGTPIGCGSDVPDKREAEALAALIEDALRDPA